MSSCLRPPLLFLLAVFGESQENFQPPSEAAAERGEGGAWWNVANVGGRRMKAWSHGDRGVQLLLRLLSRGLRNIGLLSCGLEAVMYVHDTYLRASSSSSSKGRSKILRGIPRGPMWLAGCFCLC